MSTFQTHRTSRQVLKRGAEKANVFHYGTLTAVSERYGKIIPIVNFQNATLRSGKTKHMCYTPHLH